MGGFLGNINKRTLDAEISMGGPFMMVISLLSYINWFWLLCSSRSAVSTNFTGLVIVLTAVSLVSIGLALVASPKPLKNVMCYWCRRFILLDVSDVHGVLGFSPSLLLEEKRVWTKTAKDGSYVQVTPANELNLNHQPTTGFMDKGIFSYVTKNSKLV